MSENIWTEKKTCKNEDVTLLEGNYNKYNTRKSYEIF
jgi:hypothetical protein